MLRKILNSIGVVVIFVMFATLVSYYISTFKTKNSDYPIHVVIYGLQWKTKQIDSTKGNSIYFVDQYYHKIVVNGNYSITNLKTR